MTKPFFIRHNKLLKRIHPEEVLGLSTEGNYTRIHHVTKVQYLVRSRMSKMLKQLPQDMFIKIHRFYAVSVFYIDNIDRDHLMIGDDVIPIGRGYYKGLIEWLNVVE